MFFKNLLIACLISVFLIIVAGSIVRITGSGMGCPDWPKCFGFYIPPFDENKIIWSPKNSYFKGQIVIHNEKLYVSKNNFYSNNDFNYSNWEFFKKHNYARYNPYHTWFEYINRLIGAISGFLCLICFIFSLKYWRINKKITMLSFLTLISMIFQAFIGATVVYSVLKPFKITIHMLIALFITSLITLNISFFKTLKIDNKKTIKKFKLIVILSLIISTIQIIFGTQVRQLIDELSKSVFQNNRELWLNMVGLRFEVHRSFAILVLIVNLILVYLNYKMKLNLFKVNILFVFILIEIFTGVVMSYFGMPKLFQPLHLIFASILFTIQSSILFDFINVSESY